MLRARRSTVIALLVAASLVVGLAVVHTAAPHAVMDEEFHVPLAQRFSQHDWQWDPMVTTPPGVYAAGLLWHRAHSSSAGPASSSHRHGAGILRSSVPGVGAEPSLLLLRSTNAILGVLLFATLRRFIFRRGPHSVRRLAHRGVGEIQI